MVSNWNFFTNHAHVIVCLSMRPNLTLREIAQKVGITERATHRIVDDLFREGAVKKIKHGRCNHYELRTRFPLRHPLEKHCSIGDLLRVVARNGEDSGN